MKTSTIITAIIIALLILGGLYFLIGNSEDNALNSNIELENTANSDFPNLDSDDATLDELDSIIEELE